MIRRAGRSVHGRAILRVLAKSIALSLCLAAGSAVPASVAFAAAPQSDDPWWDYQIIMWQPHTPEQNAALKNLGITAGEVIAKRIDLPASSGPSVREQLIGDQASALIASNLPWYVDNIATDFYSPYHMLGSTAAFDEARKLYEKDHGDPAAFTRRPSLSDGAWLEKIRGRLVMQVQVYRRYRPLFYNLADEPGIADTSAFWDFDVSADSLGAMRIWLRERYGSLGALNREWGTNFASWDAVIPETTEQAMRRTDGNFSSWADFKDWMNVAFARAIKMGTDAIHSADPKALAAITGAQTPGWGGYDYAYLAGAVDLIEPYDLGGNVDIVHALNSQMRIITTSFGLEPKGAHRVWHELLHGSRGLVLWEPPDKKFLRDDGTLDARGKDAAPYFREIREGIGALLINSRSSPAEIAVLYSPASMRTQWMLDWQAKGDAWARNGTRSAGDDNATDIFASHVAHLGLQGQIVSSAMVAQGALRRGAWRILILPDAIALSPQEAEEIRRFVARGGTVIADAEPATYDQHSRRLVKPLLADIFKRGAGVNANFAFGKGHAVYVVSHGEIHDPSAGANEAALRDL
ncbi:MAG TPA: alpha-amylase family protein, partial [Micropepsaceae bacterium]|nr:alpha-amylase family protein [Micropepsaceae bacterium]